MTLPIKPLATLRKGTIERERMKAEVAAAKAKNADAPKHFACQTCGHTHPMTEVARKWGGSGAQYQCTACHKIQLDNISAKAQRKHATVSRHNAKRYKKPNGKLPPWMLS